MKTADIFSSIFIEKKIKPKGVKEILLPSTAETGGPGIQLKASHAVFSGLSVLRRRI